MPKKRKMGIIAERLNSILQTVPQNVQLVAVSKTKPIEDIMEAYQAGQRHFGENKVQDLVNKAIMLPKDIQWHFIGHLQTNKVKQLVPNVSLIHAVDSWKLLAEINKEAAKINRVIPCLLQFHIAEEDTKFGLDLPEATAILQNLQAEPLSHVSISGVMGMATFTDNTAQIEREFAHLKSWFDQLRNQFFLYEPQFNQISMGMSDDYLLAIEQGSTLVRIGSSIFGSRNIH